MRLFIAIQLSKEMKTALTDTMHSMKKKFVPHITIIRKMSGSWKQVPAPGGEMMVKRVSLMKSEQRDGKRVYTEIFHIGKG